MNDFIQTVELPGFTDDKPFTVRLRRPSLLAMAAEGIIPIELLDCARRLFGEGARQLLPLDQLGRLLISVAKEAMVEPTFGELESRGITLTDMQLSAIYAFAQSGERALACFHGGGEADNAAGGQQTVFGAS